MFNAKTIFAAAALGLGALMAGCQETAYVHVGPNWDALNKLPAESGSIDVDIDIDKTQYRIGEQFSFEVTSSETGRLWAVFVDPDDQQFLLYPPAFGAPNTIQANQSLELPDPTGGAKLEAVAPAGASVMAIIVTTGDIDLYDVLNGTQTVGKALRVVEEAPRWGMAKQVLEIVE